MNEPDASARRLDEVRRRIDGTERKWSHPVEIMAVTKGFTVEAIRTATRLGITVVGENYAQELLAKLDELDELEDRDDGSRPRPEIAFIGQLQSNKVRQLVGRVDRWESVDRPSLVDEIAKRAPGARVLVQVDTTGEEGKGGCRVDDVADLVATAVEAGLVVEGLMTVGPTGQPPDAARPGFARTRALVDDLGLEVCSMGMSADIEVAVAEGSTAVRVGTALFGPRR